MSHPADLPFQTAIEAFALPCEPTPAGTPGHDVQFYRTDAHLVRSVVSFLAAGVKAGQPIIVIATAPHRQAFEAGLRTLGLDIDELLSGREAVWLDARETLNCFMEGAVPDRELFMKTVGAVFESVVRKRHYLVVRGYGEMVDLLWKDGNADGAIQLEALWNELADKYSFSLLCAYAMDNFLKDAGSAGCRRVCAHHSRVLPYEPFEQAS